jgi:hypothetical protein
VPSLSPLLAGQENVSVEVPSGSQSGLQMKSRPQIFNMVIKDYHNIYFSFLRL